MQAVVLVALMGFFVLGLWAYRTYQAKPPTPDLTFPTLGALASCQAAPPGETTTTTAPGGPGGPGDPAPPAEALPGTASYTG